MAIQWCAVASCQRTLIPQSNKKKSKIFLLIRLNAQYYEETNSKYFISRKL